MILHRPPFTIHRFATLGSTNDRLKQMSDAPEFTCVVADQQTAGRGRREREWHSPPGAGLYLSLLLRPRKSSPKIPLLSLMSAVAVAESLIQRGIEGVDIKWPNDVLTHDRKVCGILIEAVSTGLDDARVIVGIGVNLNHSSRKDFPEELQQTATSLQIETGTKVDVDEFRDQLLWQLAVWYERWKSGAENLILSRWQELSTYARGCQVAISLDHEYVSGTTMGLNDDGALLVKVADGSLRAIIAGEVARLRKEP